MPEFFKTSGIIILRSEKCILESYSAGLAADVAYPGFSPGTLL